MSVPSSKLLKLICEVCPGIDIKWDVKDAITLRPEGSSRFWARIKTKQPADLELWLVGKPGQFNLSRVEGIGQNAELESDRADGSDVLKLHFVRADQIQPAKLKAVLAEHRAARTASQRLADEQEAAQEEALNEVVGAIGIERALELLKSAQKPG